MNEIMLGWYAAIGMTALGAAAGGTLLWARRLARLKHSAAPVEARQPRERTIPLPMRRRQPPANPQATIPISKLADLQLTTQVALKKQVTRQQPAAPAATLPPVASMPPGLLDLFQPVAETAYPALVAAPDPAASSLTADLPAPSQALVGAAQTGAVQPTPAETVSDDRLLAESIAQVRQGRLEQAEQVLRGLLEANPHQPNAWFWMGWLNARRGQLDIAQHCFERALHFHHPEARRSIEWCRQHAAGAVAPIHPTNPDQGD